MKKKFVLKFNKLIPVNTPVILKSDITNVNRALRSGWISSVGPEIIKFEKEIAKFTQRKYASCVSSGSAAQILQLNLLA